MPLEQKELFKRYNGTSTTAFYFSTGLTYSSGQGVPEPESDVFSDESDSDVEGERILSEMNKYDPNFELSAAPSSPATIIYSGWQSSPVRGAVYAEDSEDENKAEASQVEDTLRNYSPSADNDEGVPCAQPQQPSSLSFTFASIRSVKEEPASQILLPSIDPSADVVPKASLSWPTILNGQSQDAEPHPGKKNKGKAKGTEEESQESMISTITPNSSNEISCSQAFPPAQRSFVAVEEDELHDSQDSESEHGSSPRTWEGGSQFSAIGDDLSEEVSSSASDAAQAEEEMLERVSAEPMTEEKDARDASPSLLPPSEPTPKPQVKRLDPPSTPKATVQRHPELAQDLTPVNVRKPEPWGDAIPEPSPHSLHSTPFLTKRPSVSTPFNFPVEFPSARLQRENAPLTLDDASSAIPMQPQTGHSVKRSIDEVETSVDRSGKRPKFNQPSKGALHKPLATDSRLLKPSEEHHSKAPITRPVLVGNGKDLRRWDALQPPLASISRSSTKLDHIRPPLHKLAKKLGTGERRSAKYSLPSQEQ